MRSRDLINLLKPLAIIKMKKKPINILQTKLRVRETVHGDFVYVFSDWRFAAQFTVRKIKNKIAARNGGFCYLFFRARKYFSLRLFHYRHACFTAVCFDFFSEFPTRTTISTTTPSEQILSVIPVYNKSRYQSFYKKDFFSSNQ